MRMKKKANRVLLLLIALALCVSLSGCLAILGTVLDNLDTVFSLLDPSMDDENLPEGTVYGSANDLAVGFNDGDFYAFWDERGETDYALSVTKKGQTTTYTTDENEDYFADGSFDLEGAGYRYSDDLMVRLTRVSVNPSSVGTEDEYLYEYDEYQYTGLTAVEYRLYTKNVAGGFTDIDYYVASRYELFELFAYLVIFRPDVKTGKDRSGTYYEVDKDVKIGYNFMALYDEDVSRTSAYEAEIKCAVASFEDSAAYSYSYEIDGSNVGNIYLKFYYQTDPIYTTDTGDLYANATSATSSGRAHYSTSTKHDRTFAIDSIEKTVSVSSSDQLYFAIKKGYRPAPVSGSNADWLYRRMKVILSYIIEDDDTEAQKVHLIYDYIVNTVIYDYEFTENVIEQVSGSKLFLYKCLYMEGVFGLTNAKTFDNTQCVAICDGLSKAFLCLARIEGLNAIKISGIAMTSYGRERGAHAWNKVEVNGKWYLVDTTWGNQLSSSSSSSSRRYPFPPFFSGEGSASTAGKQNEFLSHDYCLVGDDNQHEEDGWYAYPSASNGKARLA